jgi:hypothetical protein
MTASGSSTASTIDRPPPPDREPSQGWPGAVEPAPRPSLAAIVASLHGRTGKTLLARVLADYFVLAGTRPLLFDTDCSEQTLHAWFPYDTVVADITDVRDQMTLFDTLAARSPEARVVDVSHYVYRRFFKVMQESHFVPEARARQVEPVIFYIADRNPDAYEEGRVLRERFDDCPMVLVENAFVGRVKDLTRRSAGYRAFEDHDLCIALPPLDLGVADAIDDPGVSLSDIMSRPLSRSADAHPAGLSFEQQTEVRGWLVQVFREIHRVTRTVEERAPAIFPDATQD